MNNPPSKERQPQATPSALRGRPSIIAGPWAYLKKMSAGEVSTDLSIL